MADQVKAAVLHGAGDLRIEDRKLNAPPPGAATVKLQACGLCGSDLHCALPPFYLFMDSFGDTDYAHGRNGAFVLRSPLVLGHEASGVITAVGEGVKLAAGSRVAIEAGVPCSACEYCLSGRYNLCPSLRFGSSAKTFPHLDGLLSTAFHWPAHLLHVLPDNVSFAQGALAEPLCVVLHALKRVHLTFGQSVLVIGAGPVGILACAAASASGANPVAVVDIDERKLAMARQWTTSSALVPSAEQLNLPHDASSSEVSAAQGQALKTSLGSEQGYDVVIEASGAPSAIRLAIHCAKTGGKVALVGMGSIALELPLAAAALREVDLIGVFRYANVYPAALSLFASGKLGPIEKLVTHSFALEHTTRAFEVLQRGQDEHGTSAVKVMIVADP